MNIVLPHTIENITGEKLTFLRIVVKDGVEYLETESEVQPNAGPPMYVHYKQDESMTVLSGKIGYQELKGEKKYAGPGETVLFKVGVPHKFWNAGNEPLRISGYVSPANNMVYFLSQIYRSMNENGGRPGMYDSAYLLGRYKTEFRMLEIPTFVQKVIFLLFCFLVTLGERRKNLLTHQILCN